MIPAAKTGPIPFIDVRDVYSSSLNPLTKNCISFVTTLISFSNDLIQLILEVIAKLIGSRVALSNL